MRKRIALEAYDPVTLWPRHVFDSFTVAAQFGYKRSLIAEVIAGRRRTHWQLGWRYGDGTSRLPEFISTNCVLSPESTLDLSEFVRVFSRAVPGVDCARAGMLMRRNYDSYWELVRLPHPHYLKKLELVRGLQWREANAPPQ